MNRLVFTKFFLFSLFLVTISLSGFAQKVKQTGTASYYADKFEGRTTANGEKYHHSRPTAAHRTLPFGTVVKVTNISNGNSVTVKINDRGPFVDNRIIDLSKSAAETLGFLYDGLAQVEIEVIDPGDGRYSNVNANIDKAYQTIDDKEYYSLEATRANPKGYGVQIGTFSETANLVRLSENLKSSYRQRIIVQVIIVNNNEVYRMIVGRLKSRKKAEYLKSKLQKIYPGCFVVNFNKS